MSNVYKKFKQTCENRGKSNGVEIGTLWKIAAHRKRNFPTLALLESDAFQLPLWKVERSFLFTFYSRFLQFSIRRSERKEKFNKLRSSIAKIWLFLRYRVCALSQFAKQIKNSFAEASPSEGAKEEKSFPFDLNGKTAELDQRELRSSSSDHIPFHFDTSSSSPRVVTPKFTSYKHMCGLRSFRTRNSPSKRTSLRWGDSCFCF